MASDLEKKIINQIEYYFGDINLPRDKFLIEKIKEDEGWVTIEVLLTFKRLAALSNEEEVIAGAIEKSENKLVCVSEDKKKVRRNPDLPAPELNEERKQELMKRTAYAKGFPLDETLDAIRTFLDEHGPVETCLKRNYLDKIAKEHKFKGSCFIIFKDVEQCKKFVEAETIKYKEVELIRKMQADYYEQKKTEIEERRNKKGKKNKDEAKEIKVNPVAVGSVLFFSGIKEDQTVTREIIRAKVEELCKSEIAFIDYNKGQTEGYIRFTSENAGNDFHKTLEEGNLDLGEAKIVFKTLDATQEEEYNVKHANDVKERRNKNKYRKPGKFNNRKRKGNFSNDSPRSKK
ncbi:PREDICTED: la protein homolog [Nicrophorus vespilloides]|uniref:La protein homolog n=1 Tax=Nicrophorus vespilloides TaxID=110193 RepID=A0ABM1ND82_NICVS|nr:PREDICTED: la protein homolog [Nicrophorus vespilloides]